MKTLDETLSIKPDRFAVFNYAHVPWMKPAQKILQQGVLPSPETKLELLKLTIERLTSEGYVYIGMDHFARAGDELAVAQKQKTLQRNFQGYSTRGGADIYAFGMSSISQADGFYWQNQKDLPDYYASLEANKLPLHRGYIMTDEDVIRRTTIMRLMCDLGLNYPAMSKLLNLDFKQHFATEIESLDDMEADGLVLKTPDELVVTDLGRLLVRNIAMRFDAYAGQRKENRFSRTI
jgi:oxygen-independent coproporphyrinogen-3 oxidase